MLSDAHMRFLAIGATMALALAGCHDDNHEPEPPAPPQNPPRVLEDRIRLVDTSPATLRPLANDSDPDGDALTLTVVEPPLVGRAVVNADNSVTLDGLEADFRGLNRFKYRATDARGAFSEAYVVMFVATPAFRGLFVQGPPTDRKIAVTDFGAAVRVMPWGSATAPILRFRPADDGSIVAFAAQSATTGMQDVCTATIDSAVTPVCHAYPSPPQGVGLLLSPHGNWLAVEGAGSSWWLRNLSVPGAAPFQIPLEDPRDLQFSPDGERLYLRARAVADVQARYGVFRMVLAPPYAVDLITAIVASNSDVTTFAVSPDETRMVIHRQFDGGGFWRLDPRTPGVEHRLDDLADPINAPVPTSWQRMVNPEVTTLAYLTSQNSANAPPSAYYLADVGESPNPRRLFNLPNNHLRVWSPMVRPDGRALLGREAQVRFGPGPETVLDISRELTDVPDAQSLGAPRAPFYDATGVYMLGYFTEGSPPDSTFSIMHRTRGSVIFPESGIEGLTHSASPYERHPAVLLGRSPTTPTAENPSRLELVNFAAPGTRLVLGNYAWNPVDHNGSWLFIVDTML